MVSASFLPSFFEKGGLYWWYYAFLLERGGVTDDIEQGISDGREG